MGGQMIMKLVLVDISVPDAELHMLPTREPVTIHMDMPVPVQFQQMYLLERLQ